MPPPTRTKSSEILTPRSRIPLQNGTSRGIGRGTQKSRSGSVYKSVVTGGEEKLVLSPSKYPQKSSVKKSDDSLFFNDTTRFNNIHTIDMQGSCIPEEPSTIADSADEDEEPEKLPKTEVLSMNLSVAPIKQATEQPNGKLTVQPIKQSIDQINHQPLFKSINQSTDHFNGSPAVDAIKQSNDVFRRRSSVKSPPPSNPAEQLELSKWGLPVDIVNAYGRIGITTMFPWQVECLNGDDVLNGGNLVYSAPTSAGKTLVAEMLLLKRVMETKKKGLFILPFIALAREKMETLRRVFKGTGIRIDGMMGHLNPPGGLKLLDICVCTIEKANSLVNRMVRDKTLDQLGVIVVDELHMVGDPGRGYLIELLLAKVQHLNRTRALATAERALVEEVASEQSLLDTGKNAIQIIGMSATLPNLGLIAKWLDANLYTTG